MKKLAPFGTYVFLGACFGALGYSAAWTLVLSFRGARDFHVEQRILVGAFMGGLWGSLVHSIRRILIARAAIKDAARQRQELDERLGIRTPQS